MWQNPQFTTDLVTFTKEILNEKLYFAQCTLDKYVKFSGNRYWTESAGIRLMSILNYFHIYGWGSETIFPKLDYTF